MRDICTADDSWHGYRQKFRVFFREAKGKSPIPLWSAKRDYKSANDYEGESSTYVLHPRNRGEEFTIFAADGSTSAKVGSKSILHRRNAKKAVESRQRLDRIR